MTRKDFTQLLDRLGERGISRRRLAGWLGRSAVWIHHQESGNTSIDQRVADYAAGLIAAIDSVPVPDLTMWRNVEAAAAE